MNQNWEKHQNRENEFVTVIFDYHTEVIQCEVNFPNEIPAYETDM